MNLIPVRKVVRMEWQDGQGIRTYQNQHSGRLELQTFIAYNAMFTSAEKGRVGEISQC
jgi:hypothetical protein